MLCAKPEWHLLMFNEVHVGRLILKNCFISIYFSCSLVLTHKKNKGNSPDDVIPTLSMRNAEPGVNNQSEEEIRRRSRRLVEGDETAMMLRTETEGRVGEGQRHCDYNYQLDAMMTCPCEKNPPSLTPRLPLSFSLSLSLCHTSTNCGCHLFSAGVCETQRETGNN